MYYWLVRENNRVHTTVYIGGKMPEGRCAKEALDFNILTKAAEAFENLPQTNMGTGMEDELSLWWKDVRGIDMAGKYGVIARYVAVDFGDNRHLVLYKHLERSDTCGMQWEITAYEPAVGRRVEYTETNLVYSTMGGLKLNIYGMCSTSSDERDVCSFHLSGDNEDLDHITDLLDEAVIRATAQREQDLIRVIGKAA